MKFVNRALFLAVILCGCGASPSAPARAYRDFRGVIHVHSRFSHDSKGTYEEILAACKRRGIDFVCMTDHPPKDDPGRPLREGWRGLRDGVLFIQGAEFSDELLGIGLREPVTAVGRNAKIEAIHAQGGVAIVCHPEAVKEWNFTGYDGIEIWNTHAAFQALMKDPQALGAALKLIRENPEQGFLSILKYPRENLERWDELRRARPLVGVAGNDAHQNVNVFGTPLDPYERSLGFVTTHVLAEELSEEAILRALREGRAYVAFEFVAPAPAMATWEQPPLESGVEYRDFGDRMEAHRDGKPWILWNPFRRSR